MKKVIGGWNVFQLVWFVLFTSIARGISWAFICGKTTGKAGSFSCVNGTSRSSRRWLDLRGGLPAAGIRVIVHSGAELSLYRCDDDRLIHRGYDPNGSKEQWLVYIVLNMFTEKRHVFHKQIIADLKERRIPYITLRGSLEERMRKVDEMLAKFRPYHNFFGESIV